MLDKFFDWWPLAGLLALGGIAQLVSTLWPGLKGSMRLHVVASIVVVLFIVWKFITPSSPWSGSHADGQARHHSAGFHDAAR
jgi:hypothetical protein